MAYFHRNIYLGSTSLFAQVGIGTTTPKAALEVVSTTSGMLIPKYETLALANSNSLTTLNAADHKGLMIYIDEAANQGFWFYDGSVFVKVGTQSTPLPIVNGGTGATTATGALDALLPTQANNDGSVLTTDGTSASWQKPSSRTRSITLDVGGIDISTAQNGVSPTKAIINNGASIFPVIRFHAYFQTLVTQIPIPADWNRTSPWSVTLYYSTSFVGGNNTFKIGGKAMSLNDAITNNYNLSGYNLPGSSSTNKLMKTTLNTPFAVNDDSEVMTLFIQKDYPDPIGLIYLLGIRIDYQD